MTADFPALPAWKRLLSKRARNAIQDYATAEDVRKLGEQHFLQTPGVWPGTVSEIGTAIGGWGNDPPLLSPAADNIPVHIEKLVDTAKDYARHASAPATVRAYASDWRHFEAWCARKELHPLPPSPQVVGLYLAACASEPAAPGCKPVAVSTIERRLSAITALSAQRGLALDREDQHIRQVMQGIRRKHGRPPHVKEALTAEDIIRMAETLDRELRGLRDRAILLFGFAGGFRRSEITGLDCGRDQTEDGAGWVEILEAGAIVHLRTKTGWREKEIGRGSSERTCPVHALQTWLSFARIAHGPIFRRVVDVGRHAGRDRLNDKHVPRLIKQLRAPPGCGPIFQKPSSS
jgi:integrase